MDQSGSTTTDDAPQQLTPEQRRELIASNMGLAGAVANRFIMCAGRSRYGHHDAEDIRSEAMLGLVVAGNRFDPEYGTKFSTFGTVGVQNFVRYHLRRARARRNRPMESAARLNGNDLAEVACRPPDSPGDPELMARIEAAMDRLPKRQAFIIRRRLEGRTLQEIGDSLGICKERVRQIQDQARRSLRVALSRDGISDDLEADGGRRPAPRRRKAAGNRGAS